MTQNKLIAKHLFTGFLYSIIVTGTLLTLWNLSHESLWLDELYSVYYYVNPDWEKFWHAIFWDVHPPLYPLLVRLWADLFGDSEAALRSLSALCMLVTILYAYTGSKNLFNHETRLVLTALVAVSPGYLHFAQEVRMYSLANMFGMILFLKLVCLYQQQCKSDHPCFGSKRDKLLIFLLCVMQSYTHYFFMFSSVMMITTYSVLVMSRLKDSSEIRDFIKQSLPLALWLCLFLFAAPWFVIHLTADKANIEHLFGFTLIDQYPVYLKNYVTGQYAYPLLLLLFAITPYLLIKKYGNDSTRKPLLYCLLTLIVFAGAIWVANEFAFSLAKYRYLICINSIYIITIALLYTIGKEQKPLIARLWITTFLILSLLPSLLLKADTTPNNVQFRESLDFVQQHEECKHQEIFAGYYIDVAKPYYLEKSDDWNFIQNTWNNHTLQTYSDGDLSYLSTRAKNHDCKILMWAAHRKPSMEELQKIPPKFGLNNNQVIFHHFKGAFVMELND